jgi:hypothetical protein
LLRRGGARPDSTGWRLPRLERGGRAADEAVHDSDALLLAWNFLKAK